LHRAGALSIMTAMVRRPIAIACVLAGCATGGDPDLVPTSMTIPATTPDMSTSSGDPDTAGDTSPDTTISSVTDPTSGDSTAGPEEPPPYLLTIDDATAAASLVKVGLAPILAEEVCSLPAGNNYVSTTVTRDGDILSYSAVLNSIQRIDPCSCTVSDAMPGLGNMRIGGGPDDQLHALVVATGDAYTLDVDAMTSSLLGPSGQMFGNGAIAWNDAQAGLYVVNADTDQLFFFSPGGAGNSLVGSLGIDVLSAGLTYHHGDARLYMCTQTGQLWTVDVAQGAATEIGAVGFSQCDNLAAAYAPVACI
jgi:hypothetical protein